MGCGSSSPVAPDVTAIAPKRHAANALRGLLLLKAEGLRKADLFTDSDPYVIIRVGAVGSSWDDKKDPQKQRTSDAVPGTDDPVFQFAFPLDEPPDDTSPQEVHVRVYDADWGSFDDFLGECQVPYEDLRSHLNEHRAYPLEGKKAQGTITLMCGSRVEEALLAEFAAECKAAEEESERGLLASIGSSLIAPLGSFASRISTWFGQDEASYLSYIANNASAALAWNKPPGGVGDDAVTKWWVSHSDGSMRWNGPFVDDCTSYSSHADVVERLRALGDGLGTNDRDGRLERENFLGYQHLNSALWRNVPWEGIGLAAPQEEHAWVRPLIVRLCGPSACDWLGGAAYVEAFAASFFAGRRTLRVKTDLKAFSCMLQHEVMLGLKLSEAEAAEFGWFQNKVLVCIGLPPSAVPALGGILGLDKVLACKARLLKRYIPALEARLGKEEAARLGKARLAILAQMVLDALVLAGGISVPTVLAYALALPFSSWGEAHLPEGFNLDDVGALPVYVLEILRKFSPVTGFPYTERSAGNRPAHRVFLNLQMAGRDTSVWGDDADAFRLRPLAQYHTKGLNFAEPAMHPLLSSANSHSCPGKDFAMVSIVAFLRAFAETARPYGGVAALWEPRKTWVAGKSSEEAPTSRLPSDQIKITYFTTSSFDLVQKESAIALEAEVPYGTELLAALSDEQRAELEAEARSTKGNKLAQTNANTRLFTKVVQLTVNYRKVGTSAAVAPPSLAPAPLDRQKVYEAPFGNLRLITTDEDSPDSVVARMLTLLVYATGELLDFEDDEDKEDLVYWDSPAEAWACISETFGKQLPPQYNTWDDLDTADGVAALCYIGVGAWYLRAARTKEAAGHDVPAGACYEVDLEYMGGYQTRKCWSRYGATAYLGAMPGGGGGVPPLLGIYTCEAGRVATPADDPAEWAHARAVFKSTLCCSLTLRDHLGHLHWNVANGLALGLRTTLGVDHPLRRLLKQFGFMTCSINDASKGILMPVNGFGHRMFGFTADDWVRYFAELMAAFEFIPFPERVKRTGLDAAFVEAWPFAVDGLAVWNEFHAYTTGYLAASYPDDDALLADAEVAAFYASFETVSGTPWKLPPLSRDALATLVTELMFQVTAVHELVGSIVEYLTSVHGIPAKVAPGKAQVDVQSHAQGLITIALTGVRQPPLMDDYTHLFQVKAWGTKQRQAAIDAARGLQQRLLRVSRDIDERNAERERTLGRKFVAFNPRIHETSVSI